MPNCPTVHGEPVAETAAMPQPEPGGALQLLQFEAPSAENLPGVQAPLHVGTIIVVALPK